MEYMLKLIACHFLGDVAFQTQWLAQGKAVNWWIRLVHSATYTAPFILFTKTPTLGSLLLFLSHFVIDSLSAKQIIPSIFIDQALHFVVIFIVWFLKN